MEVPLQTGYAVFLVVAIALTAAVGVVAWRNRSTPGATTLFWFTVATMAWLVPYLASALAESYAGTVLFATLLWVGVVATTPTFLVLILAHTGREHLITRRTLALLAIEPTIFLSLAVTNEWHWLLWSSIEPAPTSFTGFEFVFGPVVTVHAIYSYSILAVPTVLLLSFLLRSNDVYRGQAIALLVAMIAPWVASAVLMLATPPFDPTPIGFTVSVVALGIAMVRYRLTDVAPVARDTIVDTITDGIVVLDRSGRVVDVNPEGKRFMTVPADESPIGRPVRSVFPDELVDRLDTVTEGRDELVIESDRGVHHVTVDVTPLDDRLGRSIGRLFILRETTERHRHERELERQNERLERFASVVSHDLRNPLNVARGYLELLGERRSEPELEEIDRSLDRMERLIDDVLALAREGRTITDRQREPLAAVVEEAWRTVDTASATLEVDVAGHPVRCDRARLSQALENLFRNAVEHGGADVRVEVGLLESEDGTVGTGPAGFYVEDDGPGIPASEREAVLEMGYTTASDGTGLGLEIVGSVVEAHGWVLSVTEGTRGGARFEIRYDGTVPENRVSVVE